MILRRTAFWGVGAALVLTLTPSLRAGLPPPPNYALDRIRDLGASVRARRVLKEDRALAPLNLVVAVEDGVASVWGPVPSAEIGRLAVHRLESVPGIREVRPHFYAESRSDGPATEAPRVVKVGKPNLETGRMTLPRSASPALVTQRQADRPAALRPAEVFAPRPPARPDALLESIAGLRRSDDRFRTIPISVVGTRVRVGQGSAPDEAVHDLLTRLRSLPGVSEVELAPQ